MRKAFTVTSAAALLVGTALAATPASAADGTTTVSFTVVDGTLAIVTTAAATAVNTAVVGTGKVADISLGATTVNDTRSTTSGWSYAAKTTDFTSTLSGSTATISKTAAAFWIPGTVTSTLGSPTFSGQVTTPTAVGSDGASGVLLKATATSANDATFTPWLRVTASTSTPLETFTGTVTQSVV
jgi:hypothetical protein